MSHTLTQPQEIELALMQENLCGAAIYSSLQFAQARSISDSLRRGYITPYRAAYQNARENERCRFLQTARG